MKYMIATEKMPDIDAGSPLIYIDFGDIVKQYSDSKNSDSWFNTWYENFKKENPSKEELKMERVASVSDTSSVEIGEYSGTAKEKVDKILKEYGYDAP
jgi:hypothetical protein